MALYVSFAGQFYEQIDGVDMGSPLSLVIANFFMEDFEEMVLNCLSADSITWMTLSSSGHMDPTD
jgi:hypothetical protein